MDHTIVHFEIPVDDPERAIAFYQSLFGWDIKSMGEGSNYWIVRTVPTDDKSMPTRQGINGGLMKKMHPQQPWANYINVESIEDYLEKGVALGGQVALPKMPVPGMGWFAYLKDTEGNIFGIWQVDSTAA